MIYIISSWQFHFSFLSGTDLRKSVDITYFFAENPISKLLFFSMYRVPIWKRSSPIHIWHLKHQAVCKRQTLKKKRNLGVRQKTPYRYTATYYYLSFFEMWLGAKNLPCQLKYDQNKKKKNNEAVRICLRYENSIKKYIVAADSIKIHGSI